jgi:hypothetical protein
VLRFQRSTCDPESRAAALVGRAPLVRRVQTSSSCRQRWCQERRRHRTASRRARVRTDQARPITDVRLAASALNGGDVPSEIRSRSPTGMDPRMADAYTPRLAHMGVSSTRWQSCERRVAARSTRAPQRCAASTMPTRSRSTASTLRRTRSRSRSRLANQGAAGFRTRRDRRHASHARWQRTVARHDAPDDVAVGFIQRQAALGPHRQLRCAEIVFVSVTCGSGLRVRPTGKQSLNRQFHQASARGQLMNI